MITTRVSTIARAAVCAGFIGAAAVGSAAAANATPTAPHLAGQPGGLYGDPAAAAPYWRYQRLDDCALMASADVVGQLTGHEPSEQAIVDVAENTPSQNHPGSIYLPPANRNDPNSGNGTDPADIPVLLAHYGIDSVYTDQDDVRKTGIATGLPALEHDLAGGHKVIAGVNAELIWNQPGDQTHADHALVVTGVDTVAGVVHLNDSGIKSGRDEQVPIATFVKAWNTSGESMIVTEQTGN